MSNPDGTARGRELAQILLDRFAPAGTPAGTRLPTERRLALDFSVSRTTVRNALDRLEADGRISREVGRGTFLLGPHAPVDAPAVGSVPSLPDDVGPADVIVARRILEPGYLPLVVSWATERDFAEMDRCLAGGEAASSGDEFEAWDLALHRAIARASHNRIVVCMYDTIETARQGRIWGNLKRRTDSVERRDQRRREHRAVVAALRAREADLAVRAMEYHLDRVEESMLRRPVAP